jgi:hypothetical protein
MENTGFVRWTVAIHKSQANIVRYSHFRFVILDLSFVIEEAADLQ